MLPLTKYTMGYDSYEHSPQNIPRNECCCCEQPISKQQKNLLPFDWMLTTTTFVPWDILWAKLLTLPIADERGRKTGISQPFFAYSTLPFRGNRVQEPKHANALLSHRGSRNKPQEEEVAQNPHRKRLPLSLLPSLAVVLLSLMLHFRKN